MIGGVSANDLTTFLKQWNELGMRGKIPFAEIAVGNTDLWGVGPEAADGLYTITWYYKNENNPPDEKAMAADYEKKYNRPAADKAWMGWMAAKALYRLHRRRRSRPTPAEIVEALEHWSVKRGDLDVALSHLRSSDDQPSAGRRHQAEDHRQVGLFRRQGGAARRRSPTSTRRSARRRSSACKMDSL